MIKKGKKELLRRLSELEREFKEGKLSENRYRVLKKGYERELEAIDVAEKIKRMQGRATVEKPLDHWMEEAKREEELREKEELIKKYVKEPTPIKRAEKPRPTFKIIGVLLLALAFFIGSGFGLYLLNLSSEQPPTVLVNESAFPTFIVKNNTTSYTPEVIQYEESPTFYEPSAPITPSTPAENTSG